MYEHIPRELRPSKVLVEGHYVDQNASRGIERKWILDQVIVKCRCGETLHARRESARCWCGTDHTTQVREGAQGLAENYVIHWRLNDSERSTKEVYKAGEIVQALTRQPSQAQTVGAADAAAGASKLAMSSSATSDNEASEPFYLENAIVIGKLNLKHRTITRPIVAKNCWFDGPVDLRYCTFEQSVYILDCTFYQEFNSGDSTECHTIYRKEFNCDGSHFKKAASLNGIRVEGNAYFRKSRFEGPVSFNSSRCGGNAHVDGAIFEEEANFTAATFERNLECADAEFKGEAQFNSLKCGGNAHIDDAIFDKKANFTAASIGRNFECSNVDFWGEAQFNSLKCGGNAHVDGAIFDKKANFTAASIGRNLKCDNANFRGEAQFNSLKCDGAMLANNVQFGPKVDARYSSFGLPLKCENSTFWGEVDCHGMQCAHDVILRNSRFESDKRIDFTRANFEGDLECQNTVFKGDVNLRRLRCGGAGKFKRAAFMGNEVDCRYSSFGDDLDLRDTYFLGKARLGQTNINNKLRLGASCFEGEAEFYASRIKILEFIDANYQFVDASDREHPLTKRTLGEPARFNRIVDSKAELERKFKPMMFKKVERLLKTKRFREREDTLEDLFPFKPRTLTLTDISFERFHGGPHRELSHDLALRYARGQDPTKFSRDPYLQLEKYYRQIGEDDAAVTIHYEGHCALRQNAIAAWIAPEQGRVGRCMLKKLVPDFIWKWSTGYEALEQGRVNWSIFKILGPDLIWKWSTGYGHRMKRLVLWFLIFVALGTVVFWSDNALVPSDQSQHIMWTTKVSDRTVYSADLLIPGLDLRAGDVRIRNNAGWFYEDYEAFHQFAGWVLIALLIPWLIAVAKGDRSDR